VILMSQGEIIYLDPLEVEVDECNIRYDSPVDRSVIERIKEDLRSGRGIEYHITVRVRGGKYYCYIGRNRLLAAKEFIRESGKSIKIPAKVENVDDLTAMKMSLSENMSRKDLKPSEISRALVRMYEAWIRDRGLVNGEQDASLERFVKEVGIGMHRVEVMRYIALEKLNPAVLEAFDRGEIDILIAYEISKFDPEQQLLIYNKVMKYKNVPRLVKVNSIRAYKKGDFNSIDDALIEGYRKYLATRYPVMMELRNECLEVAAKEVGLKKLGALSSKLSALRGLGLNLRKLVANDIKIVMRLDENTISFLSSALSSADLGQIDRSEAILSYIRFGRFDVGATERRPRRGREYLSSKASSILMRLRDFLSTDINKILNDLEVIYRESAFDRSYLKTRLNMIYNYLMFSPGYAPRERDGRRRTSPGVMFKLLGSRYVLAERAITSGLEHYNKDEVRQGVLDLISLVRDIISMLDLEFQRDMLDAMDRVSINLDVDEGELSKIVSFLNGMDQLLEAYIYIRYYISLMDAEMREIMAEQVNKLTLLYRTAVKKLGKCVMDGIVDLDVFKRYVDGLLANDLYSDVVKYLRLRIDVRRLIDEMQGDLVSLEDTDVYDELYSRFVEYRDRYEECISTFDTRCLEILKEGLERFISEYSYRFSNSLGKVIEMDTPGFSVKAIVMPSSSGIEVNLITSEVSDDVIVPIEYGGRRYNVKLSRSIKLSLDGIESVEVE